MNERRNLSEVPDFRKKKVEKTESLLKETPLNSNIVFGIHPVREALEGGKKIEKLYIKRDYKGNGSLEGIAEFSEATGVPVQLVPIEKLDRLSKRGNHQGAVATIAPIDYIELNDLIDKINKVKEEHPALIVVMDSITDIRNFGAIARSAECAGADAIIMSAKNSAPVNGEAIRSSSGALTRIPVCRVGSLRNTLKTLKLNGIQLIAATEKSQTLLYESHLTGSVAIIMGAEDRGISVDILKLCDQKLAIPILGTIESLNVSAAAAVMLYEVVRQRYEEL